MYAVEEEVSRDADPVVREVAMAFVSDILMILRRTGKTY
jgi:hypothetical protein